ncbi:17593_t:CDS:2 [Funneliformis geosporum]|uniref:17593_t:CDS:1 n=1 Tax=Funneliformis geosporum TaxID=1117311 RepID=A0A9W4SEG5_9GLOM|nr:17593_t:CDS:2 [Funneliformis geosporum]
MFESSETPSATDHMVEKHIPTIVVFGDQSSGKRSIMTRLTGLPMPRESTKRMTTPFEIRLLQTEEPIRKITLHYIEDCDRKAIQLREVEFADITNSNQMDIENKLREAQRYLQNPSIRDINSRLPNDPSDDELPITKNTVCITIGGPKQNYSLSMVVLPGLIREYESFTISLIKEYINSDSAILVPTINANADISIQCALYLARQADPDGVRTHLELANLVKFKGEHQIANGFYVIRNQSSVKSEKSDDSLESDTIKELKKHRTWKDIPSNKFGLQNFVMKLIELQGQVYLNNLPHKSVEIQTIRFLDFDDILKNLRHIPVDNPTRFLELIRKFDKEFINHDHVNHKLYRGLQWNYSQFNQQLLTTRPIYNLTSDEGVTNTEFFDPINPDSLPFTTDLREPIALDGWGSNHYHNDRNVWTIDLLNEAVQESQFGQLAGHFPYKSVIHIVENHQTEWISFSKRLLNKNTDFFARMIDELIDNYFQEFPNLIGEIKYVLCELLRKCEVETLNRLKEHEDLEHISANRALYLTDETSLLKKQSKYLFKLQNLSSSSRQMNKELKAVLELGTELFDMMYNDEEEIDATIKNTSLDRSICIISAVTGALAYWKSSYSKYRENVSRIEQQTDNLDLESSSISSNRAEWEKNVNTHS